MPHKANRTPEPPKPAHSQPAQNPQRPAALPAAGPGRSTAPYGPILCYPQKETVMRSGAVKSGKKSS